MTSGVAEVMSLVTGLESDTEAGSQEVTGPTDPIRVIVTHTLQPDSSSITFSIELLSRLTADIKGLVLRYYVTKYTACLAERFLEQLLTATIHLHPLCYLQCQPSHAMDSGL